MKRKLFARFLVTIGIVVIFAWNLAALAEDAAKKPTYVGSKACKTCHQGEKNGKIYESWAESAHANAFAKLDSAKGETKDPKCLKCHTVGYGAGGYGAEGMDALDLKGVGCESCHGPGSEYKSMKVMKDKAASIAAGLVEPTESLCVTCHNSESPTFKSFDFKTAYAKIEHHVPVKPDSAAPAPK